MAPRKKIDGDSTNKKPGGMLDAFKYRDFSIFWTGAFIANAGGWFQSLAVPYVLFLMTGSPLWVGLAAAVQFVPIMVLAPVGGAMADRWNRRKIVISMQVLRSLAALAMFVVWFYGIHDPWLLLGLAAVTGCGQGISMPSWQSLINDLVPRHALKSAVSLNTVQFNLARSFGPALGGLVLYAWGASIAFLLTFVAVLSVVIALLFVRIPANNKPTDGTKPEKRSGGFTKGLRYLPTQPGIITAMLVVFSVGTFGMPIFQHVITFSETEFNSGELGLTILNLGLGVGTLAGVPILNALQRTLKHSTIALISMPLYGLGLVGFALSPNMPVATGFTVLIGVCFLLSLTVGNATTQSIVADSIRGRVLALSVMVYTGSVSLGAAVQGWLADLVGVRAAVVGAGLLLLLIPLIMSLGRGKIHITRLNDPRDKSEDLPISQEAATAT